MKLNQMNTLDYISKDWCRIEVGGVAGVLNTTKTGPVLRRDNAILKDG